MLHLISWQFWTACNVAPAVINSSAWKSLWPGHVRGHAEKEVYYAKVHCPWIEAATSLDSFLDLSMDDLFRGLRYRKGLKGWGRCAVIRVQRWQSAWQALRAQGAQGFSSLTRIEHGLRGIMHSLPQRKKADGRGLASECGHADPRGVSPSSCFPTGDRWAEEKEASGKTKSIIGNPWRADKRTGKSWWL